MDGTESRTVRRERGGKEVTELKKSRKSTVESTVVEVLRR